MELFGTENNIYTCMLHEYILFKYIYKILKKPKKKLTVSLWPLTVDSVRGCGTAEGPDAGRALQ